ncbi:MAG: FAD-binding protein [Christensenellales bacterium]
MAQLVVIQRKCTGCGVCVSACPFGAIDLKDTADINAACKMCGLCEKSCPEKAIIRLETKAKSVDKEAWRDILVFCEMTEGGLHPVGPELIGKAHELAPSAGYQVDVLLLGYHCNKAVEALQHYGVRNIYVYDHEALSFFRAEMYAACAEDIIRKKKPSVVLVGATALGRSLAPRLSTRFRTGLTADCTELQLKENSDLVQIRPAFGGNIMAQIVTPRTRPQFATVRYKVMDAPVRQQEPTGEVHLMPLPKRAVSAVMLQEKRSIPKATNISDADILVVGGRGLKKESDLDMIKELAALLGGEYAVSRPLVEKGWDTNARQIGLSGRTVKPKLIITCGVSGAIQFTACMEGAERIVAINTDKNAPIFRVAHVGIVGDVYNIVPKLIEDIKREKSQYAGV